MRIAVVGSRNIIVDNICDYLPDNVEEIISGGARGVDTCARKFALSNSIKLTEILPEYEKYGRTAPLKRNLEIIDRADMIIAFWDGSSRGTNYVIENSRKLNKPVNVVLVRP